MKPQDVRTRRHWLGQAAALTLSGLSLPLWAQGQPSTLERLRERGRITFGLYNDLPPFHVAGKGIEVELAEALAASLGLKASFLPFNADENMNDDLRNMVWRGHYLGFGPADVLLHVPVDKPLMDANPRVKIFAPYYRERVAMARDLSRVPRMDDLSALKGLPIAVPGQSLAGWLLIGADGGAYRSQLLTKWSDGTQAAGALMRGEVAAAAGHLSELESTLGGDPRFAIEPLPVTRMRDGWAVGCAVKADATDLAQAVQSAMNGLSQDGRLAALFQRAKVSWRPV
ncbi:substrate-binding periplasmic protein [Ideonella livida]|uniref:Amino acid ABC transporter substrate-binding protein n=1 Tax=Ideonella livida TaxID=2707176 RepID=A0A7C9TIY7_9BURK|nr:transporter substrate-binding domain-containing protein [Ideonella livida]NDY90782.1 amino acid ABC transporter substrate-binding protein [Ideonella livida]